MLLHIVRMDAVAQALSDPIRRDVLLMLRRGPMTAGAIAAEFTVSRPAVSRHLKVLREAELVSDTADGREREYRLQLEALVELELYLKQLRGAGAWQRRFDALELEVYRVRKARKTPRPNPKLRRKKESA